MAVVVIRREQPVFFLFGIKRPHKPRRPQWEWQGKMGLVVPPGQVGESCSPLAGALPAHLPYAGRMSLAGFQGVRLKLPGGDRVPGCHGEAANSPTWKNRDPVSAGLLSREPKSSASPYKDEASLPSLPFCLHDQYPCVIFPPPLPWGVARKEEGAGSQRGGGWRKGVGHSGTGSVAGLGLCSHDSLCVPQVARSISWGRRAGLLEVGLVKWSSGPEGGTFGAKHLCPPVASAGTLPVRGRGIISHRKPPFLELIGGRGLGL